MSEQQPMTNEEIMKVIDESLCEAWANLGNVNQYTCDGVKLDPSLNDLFINRIVAKLIQIKGDIDSILTFLVDYMNGRPF